MNLRESREGGGVGKSKGKGMRRKVIEFVVGMRGEEEGERDGEEVKGQ